MTNEQLDMVTPHALVSDFRDKLPEYIVYLRAKARGAHEPREDPLAGVRWICPKCTTVNGIDDEVCLGGPCGTKRPAVNRNATR